ncbi:helix-turn-helix domain-containing protein [Clostridium sp.]|uniref:helix-turn-helix domain-containing protein n=1 Tax=Clostridium sp. TaxID=1506 RepID=UPI003F2CC309
MRYGDFGNILKEIIEFTGVKYVRIATALEYDSSYISKWCNNKRLPSLNNSKYVIQKLSEFFSIELESNGMIEEFNKRFDLNSSNTTEELKINIEELLTKNYLKSGNSKEEQVDNDIKFIENRLLEFIYKRLDKILNETKEDIEILCTDNIFDYFNDNLDNKLNDNNIKDIDIDVKLGVEVESIYDISKFRKVTSLLSCMINSNFTIYDNKNFKNLNRLIVKNRFALIFSYNKESNYGAGVYITNLKNVQDLYNDTIKFFSRKNMIIEPLSVTEIENMDYVIDFYRGNNFNIVPNEGFSNFLNNELIKGLVNKKRDVLKESILKTFEKTEVIMEDFFSDKKIINIIIIKSKLLEYIKHGRVSLGQMDYYMSWEERELHIKSMIEKMRKFESINLILIDDTAFKFETTNLFRLSLFCNEDKAFLVKCGEKLKNFKTSHYKILDRKIIEAINNELKQNKKINEIKNYYDKEYIINLILSRFMMYKKISLMK